MFVILMATVALQGCLYGYGTEKTVTPLGRCFPRTASVELYFRPPDEHCVPIAMVKVAGSRFEGTAEILRKLREDAMSIGADSIFSVSEGQTVRTQGDLLLELDPKNKPTVYASQVVSGLAARCTLPDGHDRGVLATKPPDSPLGYAFGTTLSEVRAQCLEQGHSFAYSTSDASCDGTPVSLGLPGRIGFKFCPERLCRVDVIGRVPASIDVSWRSEFDRFSGALMRRYGIPQFRNAVVPAGCEGDALLGCLANMKASYSRQWQWGDGSTVALLLTGVDESPALRIVYDASKKKEPRAVPAL